MKNKFYVINENKDHAEILLYGVIGSSWRDDDPLLAKGFVNQIKELRNKYSNIKIRINTPGGSVWDGIPIFNEICNAVRDSIDIEIINDGIAYSMGAYLMLASNNSKAYRNTVFMFHCAVGGVIGNKNDLKNSAREIEIFEENLAVIMAEKTGSTKDEMLTQYFDGQDHFLSAQEALDLGLISEIIDADSTAKVPKNVANLQMSEIFAFYESKNLFPTPVEKGIESVSNLFKSNKINQHTKPDMNKETHVAINVLVGLEIDADEKVTVNTVKDIVAKSRTANEQLEAEKKLRADADASVIDLKTQITAKDTEIVNLKAELAKAPADRTTVIDGKDTTPVKKETTVVLDEINEEAKKYVTKK